MEVTKCNLQKSRGWTVIYWPSFLLQIPTPDVPHRVTKVEGSVFQAGRQHAAVDGFSLAQLLEEDRLQRLVLLITQLVSAP